MSERSKSMTREEILEKVFAQKSGKETRIVQLEVFGRELMHAVIISRPDRSLFRNLCLDVGFHDGVMSYSDSIGVMTIYPPEAVIITTDMAVKNGNIRVGFMDRFSGCMIITGMIEDIRLAFKKIIQYFCDELGFTGCKVTEK